MAADSEFTPVVVPVVALEPAPAAALQAVANVVAVILGAGAAFLLIGRRARGPVRRRITMSRRSRAGVVLAAFALILVPGSARAVDPAPTDPPAVDPSALTWAVAPVDKDGTPRSRFTYDVQPGQVITDTLQVKVLGQTPIRFRVYGADAFVGEGGSFDVLAANKQSEDVGQWVAMSKDEVEVAAGGTLEVPFTMTVPQNAIPGDHVGGIVTSVSSDVDTADSGTVRLDRRLGARVYIRVAGALTPSVQISDVTPTYNASLNPFGGSTTVIYTVTNTGNTRVQATRQTRVNSVLGSFLGGSTPATDVTELLPGSSLSFTDKVSGPRLFGIGSTQITIAPRLTLSGELPATGFTAQSAGSTAPALAWSQLILLLVVVAAGVLFLRAGRRGGARRPARAAAGAGSSSESVSI